MKKFLMTKMPEDVFIKNYHKSHARAFLNNKHVYCLEEEYHKICKKFDCKYKH